MTRWGPKVVLAAALAAGLSGVVASIAVPAVAQVPGSERADSADVARRRGELREAINRFGDGAPRTMGALVRLGYALLEASRYSEAEQVFKRHQAIAEANFPAEHIERSHPLHHLGETYRRLGRCHDGEPLLRQALALRERLVGPEHEFVARSLLSVALCLSAQTRYREAEEAFVRSNAIYERAKGAGSAEVATALYEFGSFYVSILRFAEAEPRLKQALAIRERQFGPDDFRIPPVLTSLARAYRFTERYGEAEAMAKRALTIREARYGPDHEFTAHSVIELGVIYMIMGRYAESEHLKRRALAIYERTFGPEHWRTGDAIASLAETYYFQGRYAEAVELFQRSVTVLDKAVDRSNPLLAFPLRMLGQSLRRSGRLDDSLPHLRRALAVAEAAYGPENRRVAQAAATLSRALVEARQENEAEALLRRSIAINEKVLGPDSAAVGFDVLDLAVMMNRRRQYVESERLARRAVDNVARSRGADDYGTGWARVALATALENQDRLGAALEELRRATAAFQEQLGRVGGDRGNTALAEQASYRSAFMDQAFLLWRVQRSDAERREALIAETFELFQLAQATGTEAAVARMAARFASGTDKLAELVRAREDAIERWRSKDATLVQLFGRPLADRNRQQEAQLRTEMDELDARLKGLDARIAAEFPSYASLATPRPTPLLEVQSLLRPEEALVSWLVGNRRTLIIAVRQDRVRFVRVDIGRAQLNDAVRELRRSLDPSDVATLQDIRPFDTSQAHALYQRIFAPVEALLAGVRTVFVVPDAGLQSLPLGVLVTEAPTAPVRDFADYQGVPWLARRYAMTVLPSLSALKSLRQFARVSRAGDPFVGIGDPKLDGPPGSARGVNMAKLYARGVVADAAELRKLPPLPETADELRAMAKSLGTADRHLYLGPRATERAVRALDLQRYRVVAFATHGLMAGEFSDVGEPALVMTPPAQSTLEDDGVLTASEIASLKLDADWVILSACNTAAADGTPGAEGLSGLARAFFYAGSRALLVSHWAVLSDATVKLTTRMLSETAADPKLGRAEAHRRAILALAADQENPHYAHPMFWAPFVVVGEGGASVQ